MIENKHVTYYMNQYEAGEIKVSSYVVLLFNYLKEHILNRDDIYFNTEEHENYIKFTKKNLFPLEPFQKFITAFVFLYYKDGDHPVFEQFFLYKARGAGKNGLISSLCLFFISPLHGIDKYVIPIVANSEKQAKTSFNEIYEAIESSSRSQVLKAIFKARGSDITNKQNGSLVEYETSNPKSKDTRRDGAVIYDEVHEYEDSEIVDVFSSGLGKVRNSREFFITTDGFRRGGFLDDMKERAINVLHGEAPEDPMFPFMATLDSDDEMEDYSCWQKANPMFHEPMNDYAQNLFRKVKSQYIALGNSKPSARIRFMTKRMNRPATDLTTSVATIEEIKATNRPMPDLEQQPAVGGLDYASVRDFASAGLTFKDGEDYIWKTHSFVRREFLQNVNIKAPIDEWEKQGLLTIVDGPVISMDHVVDWFVKMRETYGVDRIVVDMFRLDLVKPALEAAGFDVRYIRNPKAIHSQLSQTVETLFAERKIIFGDNPLMRWMTNNVYVHIKKDGNKEYLKKDEVRRKTDGFQAFIYSLWEANEVFEEAQDFYLDEIVF
ncbi:terminase TerL endonuclease subunit [Salimicrobium album]|uniref:Phage terminase-like protein, large subunit, contains N-terminal HTH domain n=1 Tax=Salimicrobium album TaxID=50717 RepID=A0A1H3DEY0_9BACI|nr:terminase TerL endonuclease subunit [Salimicrobium album]SDX64946.1 Phage terminase-like protein, large subunit, contains N-terminal HTH domain [Salimicrobium album]